MRGQLALESDWYKRNKFVPEKVTRKATQDELHDAIQE